MKCNRSAAPVVIDKNGTRSNPPSTHFLSLLQQVYVAFQKHPIMMLKCSRITGVKQAGIYSYAGDLRKSDRIAVHYHGLCLVIHVKVGFHITKSKLFSETHFRSILFDQLQGGGVV